MRIRTLALIFAGLTVSLLETAHSQDASASKPSAQQQSRQEDLAALIATNPDRTKIASLLYEERNASVKTLMAILDGTNSDEVKMRAVVALGEYRASEAVPFIVAHFDWDDQFGVQTVMGKAMEVREVTAPTYRPMSEALQEIGSPAIPALLGRIAEPENAKENTITRCLWLCRRIEGDEVTQFRLQKLLDRTKDQKKRERVQVAVDTMTQYFQLYSEETNKFYQHYLETNKLSQPTTK
jgi:HEAT repeat protein